MGEIKLQKNTYDMTMLSYLLNKDDLKKKVLPLDTTNNLVSESVTELYQIYGDLIQLVNEYIEAYGDTIKSLKNAGNYVYQMDKKMANSINSVNSRLEELK